MEYLAKLISILVSVKEYVGLVIFGGIGGIVYLMLSGKDIRFSALCRSFFVSAFSGLMAGMMAHHFNLDITVSFVAAGLAGFAGGITLIWILTYFNKKAGLQSDEDIEKLKMGMNKDTPAECVLTQLAKKGLISINELKTILDGDFTCLINLVSLGKLDGICFESIARWQRIISSPKKTETALSTEKALEDEASGMSQSEALSKIGASTQYMRVTYGIDGNAQTEITVSSNKEPQEDITNGD